MTRRKVMIFGAIAAATATSLFLIFRKPAGTEVETAVVGRGDLTATVSASGVVQPLRSVEISSPVSGEIDSLPVREGQEVRKGDLLAQLDQTAYLAQVRQAGARLDLARANLARSRAQFERSRQLFEMELISRQEWEIAQANYRVDRAQVTEAKAALDHATDQLTDTRITAPISGTITRLDVEIGEVMVPGTTNIPGTVLMVLADLSRMEVACSVDEADISRIRKGQPGEIEIDAFRDRTFTGTVTEISLASLQNGSPATTSESPVVDYEVSLLLEDTAASGLKTGMTADVEIITAELRDVTLAPLQAVVTRNSTRPGDTVAGAPGDDGLAEVIFLYDRGFAVAVPVTTGVVGEEYIEIKSGIEPGARIITGPFSVLRGLEDGERVRTGE